MTSLNVPSAAAARVTTKFVVVYVGSVKKT